MAMMTGAMTPELLESLRAAVEALEAKQAFEIAAFDVSEQTSLTDAFVLCSVGSSRQAQAVADEIERSLKERGVRPLSIEGYAQGGWVLLDYGDFVVHVFLEERREYYALERLWGDATEILETLRSG
jgi:ribosome-associated protein